ncbi:MAG: hypothetical protein IJ757_03540 [Clostridiales bacterium]|nr:hypothetical protein [Clostridiales bacterium]
MLIDHIAMFLLSPGIAEASWMKVALYAAMRVIGRLTGPIMLFFLVEGFVHTSSRFKYGARLLVFGLISQVPYALSHYNTLLVLDFNVIITLFITFLMLLACEKIENRTLRVIVTFVFIMITFCCDWGVIGPFMAWLFYQYRDDRNVQIKAYSIICAIQVISAAFFLASNGLHWYGELWQAGLFLVIPFLLWYNGEAGSRKPIHKWAFYIIYPLHFIVFWLIKFHT